MSKANITIHKCIQDVHDIGGEMISQVYFSMNVDGKIYNNLCVTVSHNFGIDYSVDPLEVHKVEGLDINLNYGKFSDIIENYYRSLVGSSGSGISFGSGASGIRMRNNTFIKEHKFDVNIVDSVAGGW